MSDDNQIKSDAGNVSCMQIFLIDGTGPFFRDVKKRRINWSKIPFTHLKLEGKERDLQFKQIREDMDKLAAAASKVGYNSVSLDDVAHLAQDPWYETETNQMIETFQEEFRRIFAIIKGHNLDLYLTMDVLSFTPELKIRIKNDRKKAFAFLGRQIKTVLSTFPEIRGIILRVGECDGKDVKGYFKSELLLRRPGQLNQLLRTLLPLFEQYDKNLILRNWTVGAYSVGDFIWHRGTTAKVLKGINSPNFILSMKYGESDFFRYLPLNKHFFRIKCKKIIEFQARREYEGCGEYPSFIGWDYQDYARMLKRTENMVGVSVWCQTGGWLPFRRLTYLEESGFWNELNSFVTLHLFKYNSTVEEAVAKFAAEKGIDNIPLFLDFLRLDDEVIKELLYIQEFAGQKLFFRRVRLPPLLNVFWNNIFINHSVRKVLLTLIENPQHCVDSGFAALEKLEIMKKQAKQLNLPVEDVEFMADSFALLALARQYYFGEYNVEIREQIKAAKKAYKQKYPKKLRPRYRIKTNYTPFKVSRRHIKWLFKVTVRSKRGYRVLDYLLTLHLLGILYRLFVRTSPKTVPKFARKHAMGIDTIFK